MMQGLISLEYTNCEVLCYCSNTIVYRTCIGRAVKPYASIGASLLVAIFFWIFWQLGLFVPTAVPLDANSSLMKHVRPLPSSNRICKKRQLSQIKHGWSSKFMACMQVWSLECLALGCKRSWHIAVCVASEQITSAHEGSLSEIVLSPICRRLLASVWWAWHWLLCCLDMEQSIFPSPTWRCLFDLSLELKLQS